MPAPPAEGDRAGELSRSEAGGAAAPEPTLPELLRAGRSGRIVAVALALLAAALLVFFLIGGGGSFSYAGEEAPPFSVSWGEEMEEVDSAPPALFALASDGGESLRINSLSFETDGGEPLPRLAIAAERSRTEIEAAHPGARVLVEGWTELAVDRGPEAYQLAFAAPTGDDGILIGKRLLVPDPNRPGEGVEIEITERTTKTPVIEKVERAPAGFFANWPIQLLLEDAVSVRTEESLEQPLRTFRFE